MTPIDVLVLLPEGDPSADYFNRAISDAGLDFDVKLRYCAPADAPMYVSHAEVVACGVLRDEALEEADRLSWIAYWSAGLDGKLSPQLLERNLLLTNASGVHGPNITEHVMAFMLMFTRRFDVHLRNQAAAVWDRQMPVDRPAAAELTGQTLAIVGYGRIGACLAERARSFGMRVIAVKRDVTRHYSSQTADLVDEVYSVATLPKALAQADHVCIAAPYTPETHHLFDAEMIGKMRPDAYLYNIARGAIIDEAALIEALQQGRIAGAGLDVFENEPLAADSPLWHMPNVFITPHVAGLTPYYFQRFAVQFAENMKRYLRGEPLENVYDAELGY